MEVITLCVFGVFASITAIVIKKYNSEVSSLIVTVAAVIILSSIIKLIVPIFEEYMGIADGVSTEVFSVLIKSLGICYLTSFASDICTDSGQNVLAGRIETAGKIGIIIISFPLVRQVISSMKDLLI